MALNHLAQSQLYKENLLIGGHSAVWGSYFDLDAKRWGYACCKGFVRERPCPFGRDDLTESMSEFEGAVKKAKGPAETLEALVAAADDIHTTPELVRRYIDACRHDWEKSRAEGKAHAAEPPPTAASLRPFVDVVAAKSLEKEQEDKLRQACMMSLAGDHLQAQQAYIGAVFGNAKWVTGGMGYISSDAPKGNERCWGQKYRTIKENPSLLDTDSVRGALQQLRRLMSFMEARSKS